MTVIAAIQAPAPGAAHELVDNHGVSYGRVVMASLRPTTPVMSGSGAFCDYQIEYRQLP